MRQKVDRYAKSPSEIQFNKKIGKVIDSFINDAKSNNRANLYELFIDRQSPHSAILTLGKRNFDPTYLKRQKPLFYTQIQSDTVWVYTGIEEYINSDYPFNYYNEGFEFSWTVVDSFGVLKVSDDGMPFLPQTFPDSH